ncbi:MAG: CotH kinase family protein [Spirochaetales bacterium]|nr:CotH kinase family protein [Spirochaetales bacterium]
MEIVRKILAAILFSAGICSGFSGCMSTPGTRYVPQYNSKKVEFSKRHGFYYENFYVELSFNIPGAIIRYTLDASSPSEMNGENYTTPIFINKTTVLRAMAFKENTLPSGISTQTYIFPGDVIHQSGPKGKGWPAKSINGQVMDYEMDPDITSHKDYKDIIIDSLLYIPSMSLATDLRHLFDVSTGIYANPMERGKDWERLVSVELIYPFPDEEKKNFMVNGGLRIRGAYSRLQNNPKHSFRLFFKTLYGVNNLEYPLFDTEGVDEFDKIDLRTSQNYAWAKEGDCRNTMVREVFSRDIMREMGQPYTRSRYLHLYINGYYWGVYQTQERADAFFAQSYFGGNSDDYDIVKVECGPDTGDFEIELTDGNFDAYKELYEMMKKGFNNDRNYYFILGKNPDGTINPDYKVMLDEVNLIDYMLVIFYTGNFDAPITRFRSDMEPNNFYAIYDRNGWSGWKYIMHDAEHSMFQLYDDRTGPFHIRSFFKYFNPGYLHQELMIHPEYRTKFIDRVYKHFYGNGVFTPQTATRIMQKRVDELDLAMIAESARWGDSQTNVPCTKKDWQKEIDYLLKEYIPKRRDIVIHQLKEKKMYPGSEPPQFFYGDRVINESYCEIDGSSLMRITNPSTTGFLFYTLDGSDPRNPGGIVSDTALSQGRDNTGIKVRLSTTTIVKARVKNDEEWSALQEVVFYRKDEDYSGLRISEIHYHPPDRDGINGDECEFMELFNAGNNPVNLTAARFTCGIQFTFPAGTLLPGEHTVIVRNDRVFMKYYGTKIPVAGVYEGKLENRGETLIVQSPPGKIILEITYDDKDPWPDLSDGRGFSIGMTDGTSDMNDGKNWTASKRIHGSPGF